MLNRKRTPARKILATVATAFLLAAATAHAQTPIFDVVSIHQMPADDPTPAHITNSPRSASIRATNVKLTELLEIAYDIPDLRISGGPKWIASSRFTVEAKSDTAADARLASLPIDEERKLKRSMLTSLLTERFGLVAHDRREGRRKARWIRPHERANR